MKKISILLLLTLVVCLFSTNINAAEPRAKKSPKHVVLGIESHEALLGNPVTTAFQTK